MQQPFLISVTDTGHSGRTMLSGQEMRFTGDEPARRCFSNTQSIPRMVTEGTYGRRISRNRSTFSFPGA